MSIPANLLPVNVNVTQNIPQIPNIPPVGVPNNLLPVNVNELQGSVQSLMGQIPSTDPTQIPYYSTLNTVIPDNLFTTGSIDQVKNRTLRTAESYLNGLPVPTEIPEIPSIPIPKFPPPRPSYGQIKNFINTKIDRIKKQRQQASVKTFNDELKKQQNPFTYRESLKNKTSNK